MWKAYSRLSSSGYGKPVRMVSNSKSGRNQLFIKPALANRMEVIFGQAEAAAMADHALMLTVTSP